MLWADLGGLALRHKSESRSISGISGSNPTEGMAVGVLCLCVVRRADRSFRGVLQGVCVCVYLIVGDLETSTVR